MKAHVSMHDKEAEVSKSKKPTPIKDGLVAGREDRHSTSLTFTGLYIRNLRCVKLRQPNG